MSRFDWDDAWTRAQFRQRIRAYVRMLACKRAAWRARKGA